MKNYSLKTVKNPAIINATVVFVRNSRISKIAVLLLVIAFGGFSYSANAQTELIYNGGVYQNEIRLTPKTVKELMKDDKDALSKFKSGRMQYITGKCIFYTFAIPTGFGAVCIMAGLSGYGGDSWLFGSEFYINMGIATMILGGTGMFVGYGVYYGGAKKMEQAVELYNANINKNKVSVSFGFTGNGVGLSVGF